MDADHPSTGVNFARRSTPRIEVTFETATRAEGPRRAFLTRRLENVRGEFSITALAYNIRRAISLVGVPALIAAARA